MKHLLLFAAAIVLPASAALSAQDTLPPSETEASEGATENLALALAILNTAYPDDSHIALFQETTDQLEAQMAQTMEGIITDAGAMEIVTRWQQNASVETDAILMRNIPALMDAWATAFADIYTKQELEDILAFVSTPSGQSFMANQTKLLSHPAFAQANQAFMAETMEVVTGKVPELVQELQEYEASKQASAE